MQPETEQHLLWECSFARRIWAWATHVLQQRSGHPWSPRLDHALLGNRVPFHVTHVQHWWDLFRGTILWQIWTHRNAQRFQTADALNTRAAIAYKAWAQLVLYIQLDFRKLQSNLKTASVNKALDLKQKFVTTWGNPPLGPYIHQDQIVFPAVPYIALLQ
jgi:hypothetical protein